MLFCVSGIATGIETISTSDALGAYLDLCGTIISSLDCFPKCPLIKALLLVIIKDLIVCRNVHEKMMLHAYPYPRVG